VKIGVTYCILAAQCYNNCVSQSKVYEYVQRFERSTDECAANSGRSSTVARVKLKEQIS